MNRGEGSVPYVQLRSRYDFAGFKYSDHSEVFL